ncbi:GMC family oxidoreductase [Streptomyces sp. JJ36]|uniref:GMC family oxidoreductase n=1 Tax=Streptomyces sp. JJ36 TaxID=2736645 RepID=UPI0027E3E30D|nr:GMC family oxidoreductase [Streptomyces sp. JJ36]MCF6524570.1 GMC family oxidoreductase [Streptomyces sp. JJ36]
MTDKSVIVIGSGFGGSVAALRLAEKGYRVTVLEAGRRFHDTDFAASSWQVHRLLWAPWLGLTGIVRLRLRRRLLALTGIGVGGGSLAYAGVHHRPGAAAFRAPGWDPAVDWAAELAPHYATAERMLGTSGPPPPDPATVDAEAALHRAAETLGLPAGPHAVRTGIHVGTPGVPEPDPYFSGQGPPRTGCTQCARCVLGCRVGAKNTLVKNYLYLAEKRGARIRPLTTATGLRPRPGGGWDVHTTRTGLPIRRTVLRAGQVVLAAGAWGTAELLHRARAAGALPRLSPALGTRTCTNREVLLAVSAPGFDTGPGVAIRAAVHAGDGTLVQLARLGRGSNPLAAALTPLPGPRRARAHRPPLRHFGRRTALLLAMEGRSSSLTSRHRHGRLTFRHADGPAEPVRLPAAEEVARGYAEQLGGTAHTWWPQRLLRLPCTAHLLGGCPLGTDPRTSVADPWHRVHGHPGLHLADASVVPANLGGNPALTVTALAERAFAAWPPAGAPGDHPPPGPPHRPARSPE